MDSSNDDGFITGRQVTEQVIESFARIAGMLIAADIQDNLRDDLFRSKAELEYDVLNALGSIRPGCDREATVAYQVAALRSARAAAVAKFGPEIIIPELSVIG